MEKVEKDEDEDHIKTEEDDDGDDDPEDQEDDPEDADIRDMRHKLETLFFDLPFLKTFNITLAAPAEWFVPPL